MFFRMILGMFCWLKKDIYILVIYFIKKNYFLIIDVIFKNLVLIIKNNKINSFYICCSDN